MITYRISWTPSRSLELHMDFQMSRLSCRRLTLESSASGWSKQLSGARKMIELTPSK